MRKCGSHKRKAVYIKIMLCKIEEARSGCSRQCTKASGNLTSGTR